MKLVTAIVQSIGQRSRCFPLVLILLLGVPASAQTPTWNEDIACIAFSHCATCHHDGGIGSFDITSYANAYFNRLEIAEATEQRVMPPWPPDPEYRPMAHERVLTQDEIDLIAAWVQGGAPEGPPEAALEPPVFDNGSVLANADISVIMEAYTIPPSPTDVYQCFVLNIDNPTDRYITGIEVVPGNTEHVHHVLVFQDTTGQAQQLDDDTPEPGYVNFGGIGVNSAKLIGIWVPGSDAVFTPPGMGIKLYANADVVIQVHYPASAETGAVDMTRVNLQLSPSSTLRSISIDPVLDHINAITDGPLVIAPYQVRSFHSEYTVPVAATITAIGPHCHLLGQSMKSWAVLPNGDTIPLIDIPDWDFHWQGLYAFRNPIYLPPGTVLHGEAWYDNTAENEENPNSPPDWVWLGESTTNEMMLFYFAYTNGLPGDTSIVVDDGTDASHYLDCAPLQQVGINEASAFGQLEVWPSPARDQLFLRSRLRTGELVMTDVSGRVVRRIRATDPIITIAVNDLARGVYSVQHVSNSANGVIVKVLLE